MCTTIWKRHTLIGGQDASFTGPLIKVVIAVALLVAASNSFARVDCSAGPAQMQYIQAPSPDEVKPGLSHTIIGVWHELPPQVAVVDCTAGTDDAGMTINPIGYWPDVTYIGKTAYMTYYDVGDTMAPVLEFRANGGAWTPVDTWIGTNADFSVSPPYTLRQGESVTIQFRYAWARLQNLYAGDTLRWVNQVDVMAWGSPTWNGKFSQYYITARGAHSDTPIPWITCAFYGSGTEHGADTLAPVDLGTFDASTFTQSPWKSVGIKNVGRCAAQHVYMSFRGGPGYVALDDYRFAVKMDGTPDPALGVELQYKDPNNGTAYRISTRGYFAGSNPHPPQYVPPPPGIDYGFQARLVKVGNDFPATGSSGTSVIVATVNYQ